MNKGVIFDMDGVIIDSQPMHYEGDMMTLEYCNIHSSLKELQEYAGTSDQNRYKIWKEKYNLGPSIQELIAYRENIMLKLIKTSNLEAITGIRKLLSDIKDKSMKLALASSSTYRFIEAVLCKLNIKLFFDAVVSGDDISKGKPAPDIFLKAAELISCNPKECVVIEDSANGVNAAANANMKCVGYINKNSGNQNITASTVIIEDFSQINALFIKNL